MSRVDEQDGEYARDTGRDERPARDRQHAIVAEHAHDREDDEPGYHRETDSHAQKHEARERRVRGHKLNQAENSTDERSGNRATHGTNPGGRDESVEPAHDVSLGQEGRIRHPTTLAAEKL